MKKIFRNCLFCGAYGQTDEKSDAYMFPEEAAEVLGLDIYQARETLLIKNGGIVLAGDKDDPEPIILLWAKKREALPTLHCLRCGHDWYPRSPESPKQCPKCRSPYWDRPRKKGS